MSSTNETQSLRNLKKFLEELAPNVTAFDVKKVGVQPTTDTLLFILDTPSIRWDVVGYTYPDETPIFSNEIKVI